MRLPIASGCYISNREETHAAAGSSATLMSKSLATIPIERVERAILLIRGERVILDTDLATLYGVLLDSTEFKIWRSQFVTSKEDRKGLRYLPMAFTEQGVAMLSSVLRSQRAIAVNVEKPSSACGRCCFHTPNLHANLKNWKRNTTRSSRSCLMRSDN